MCVGIFLQLLIGLVAVRWDGGRIVFQCLGKKAEKFLEFAYVGSEMVYGNFLVRKEAVFAFQVFINYFLVLCLYQYKRVVLLHYLF